MNRKPRRNYADDNSRSGCRIEIETLETRVLLSGGYTPGTVASFTNASPEPFAPTGRLVIDSSGNLFGVAASGGANGTGAVFEIPAGTSTPATVASFPASSTPLGPSGLVMDAGGNLYGFTQAGGDANNDGTVFKIPKGGNAIQTVAQFDGSVRGANPGGNLVIDSKGNVFGVTAAGGGTGGGSVWELPSGSSTIMPLAYMPTVTIGGVAQQAGVGGLGIDASGNLFGTTRGNAAQGVNGTVWELPIGANTVQKLATFAGGGPGATPVGALAVNTAGFVYGVTSDGGNGGSGTVWQFQSGVGIVPLATLGGDLGATPAGGVVLDANGNVFGTSSTGGAGGKGAVWELHNHSTDLTVLQSFSGTEGATPTGDPITDRFGDVFGTTSTGGAGGGGTVFVLNLGGASTSAAGLTSAVIRSTLPANVVVTKAVRGSATVKISNPSKSTVRGVFAVNVYATSDGAIDDSAAKLGSRSLSFNLPRGKSKTISLPVSFNAASEGNFAILAQVVDVTGNTGTATTGPTVTAAAPFVSLSGAFTKVKLPAQLVAGQSTKGSATVKVTNHGNVTSKGPTTVTLLASPDGTLDAAVQIAAVTRNVSIAVNGSTSFSVPVTSIPSDLEGSLTLIAQITDPNGGITTTTYSKPITVTPA